MERREEYALVLDYLPYGKSGEAQREPVAQVLGEAFYTLLEVIPKPDAKLKASDRVYIGSGERDKIDHVKGRVLWRDLTSRAQNEARALLKGLVKEREAFFVDFFNKAGAINIRAHTLEHIPSVGKKHLSAILEARDRKKFESFEDVRSRVPHLRHIEDLIVERIVHELEGEAKYYLFAKPPAKHEE
jgi:putative nucleotide binding protein